MVAEAKQRSRALLLLSGGIDSALAGALRRDQFELHALTIEYGQPVAEKEAAISMADWLQCAAKIICRIPTFNATREPSHYFPLRNSLFLAWAAHHAERIGAAVIIVGANADDQADYPDCRADFFAAFARAVSLGSFTQFEIDAPLIGWTKAAIVKAALDCNLPLDRTLSCYRPRDYIPCGTCNACKLRAAAFQANNLDAMPTRLNVEREHFKSGEDEE